MARHHPTRQFSQPHQRLPALFLAILLLLLVLPGSALASSATSAVVAQEGGAWYVVQKGDTLYRLAKRYGVSVEIIVHANGLFNPDRIRSGQRLWIPAPAEPIPPEEGLWHTVQRGENLYRIALRYDSSVEAIAAANNIANPNRLQTGQHLWIPGGSPGSSQPPDDNAGSGSNVWIGLFYPNRTLSGAPIKTANTDAIDFSWGANAPAGLPVDSFSAIWTGTFPFQTGVYRFLVTTDDGARLYVDDNLVIDGWRDQAATGYFADVNITGGQRIVRVEYYEAVGQASLSVSWRLR